MKFKSVNISYHMYIVVEPFTGNRKVSVQKAHRNLRRSYMVSVQAIAFRKVTFKIIHAEFRSCVRVEVAVLGFLS